MSQDGRPSPIQPAIITSAADTMAQVQRPTAFAHSAIPTPYQPFHGPALPPIRNGFREDGPHYNGPTLPPLQLPPMTGAAAARQPDYAQTSRNLLPIKSLLSNEPESPKGTKPPSQVHPPLRTQDPIAGQPSPVFRSPAGRNSVSPRQPRPQLSSYPPATNSYINASPIPFRYPATALHDSYHAAPLARYASASSEPEQAHHSPAGTVHSYAHSYYESSGEPSPQTTVPPVLSSQPRPNIIKPPPVDYNLSIRQQPAAARACGFGERDRRVIDPPPILELKITNKATGAPDEDPNALLALHCTLIGPDRDDDETEVPAAHPEMASTRRLMGTLVASPYQAKDEHGIAGTFFVFPDLSCRSPGKYRLSFKLLRVDPQNMTPGAVHGTVSSIKTDVFSVFTAKDFPGMRASSALLKALRRQGLNVGVKKGSEARKTRGKGHKDVSSDEDDDSDTSEQQVERRRGSDVTGASESAEGISPKSKARKKAKRRKHEA